MTTLAKVAPPLPVVVTAVCGVVAGLIYMLWPGVSDSTLEAALAVVTRAHKWETLEIDASGVVVRNVYNLFPIASILGLTFLSFVGVALGVMRIWDALDRTTGGSKASPSEQVAATGFQIENEIISVLAVVGAYFRSQESYSNSLVKARSALFSMTKPEQARSVVNVLLEENLRMQRETTELREKLEQSHSQIESLRSNLTKAEAVGMRDSLTAVGNRRCFDATLSKEVGEAHDNNSQLCLIMGDIDNFKQINDRYGHLVGDDILKMFARLLSDNLKGRDTVARYGGEEFAIILPETQLAGAAKLAERIRSLFEAKKFTVNKSGERIDKLTASFGVALLREGDTPEMIVQRADAKLYEAKCNGRNRVAVYGMTGT